MRTKQNVEVENGHVVNVYQKTRLVEKKKFPTYGSAMRYVVECEKKYDEEKFKIEYRDERVFIR